MVPSPHPHSPIFPKKSFPWGILWTNPWEGAILKVIQWCVDGDVGGKIDYPLAVRFLGLKEVVRR